MITQRPWLIIADGEPLTQEKTQSLAKDKSVIALDGALKKCLEYQIIPDLVIGDFDSLSQEYIDTVKSTHDIIFMHDPCQNTTDLQKALNYLAKNKVEQTTICHATGYRLDHSLYNLRLLKRFHAHFTALSLITDHEKVYFIKNQKVKLIGDINQAVALLSYPQAYINSTGLKYDMKNYEISHGHHESTCNCLSSNEAYIEVNGEALLLISHEIDLQR